MSEDKIKIGKNLEEIQQLNKDKITLQTKINYINEEIQGYKKEIKTLMEKNKIEEFYNDNIQLYAKFYITTTEKFNSKGLKDSNPLVYESCRVSSKRFDFKVVKKKYPEVYRSFNELIESKSLKIEEVKLKNGKNRNDPIFKA